MAKIIPPQEIPSEFYDELSAIGGVVRPNDVAQRRYPWRIKQPRTSIQANVWDKFLFCTRCFGEQNQAQREWWYDQSIGSGLFYYTYFMKQTLTIVHLGLIPAWCGEVWSEFFPGTKLDLVRWKEPWSTVFLLPWYVNEAFIAGLDGGEAGKKYRIECETHNVVTPLHAYSLEYKVALWLTGPNIYNDEAGIFFYSGRNALRVYHNQAYFVVGLSYPPPHPWWFPVELGVLYSVKVRFPDYNPESGETLMEVYLNGELMATKQEPWPWANTIRFHTFWWNSTGQNKLVTKIDDIIVRKI